MTVSFVNNVRLLAGQRLTHVFCPFRRDEEAPAMVEDPNALKPEGWLDDEPELVADPSAEKPDDW